MAGGGVTDLEGGSGDDDGPGDARYVFRVTVRLEPEPQSVALDPSTFETVLTREADPPGTPGWLFFRDNLWRGDLADEAHFRELTQEALGVTVLDVSFRELQTDEEHLAALKDAIADDLDLFNADSVSETLSKYLGSSIRVADSGDFEP